MKSIKSKLFLLSIGVFAFSALSAQDTTKWPKTDTSKAPKHHDSTSVSSTNRINSLNNIFSLDSFALLGNEEKPVAKAEAIKNRIS